MQSSSSVPSPVPVVDPWLRLRIQNAFNSAKPVQLEASLYGPLNMYLNIFFPPSRGFMVKPQANLVPGRPNAHFEAEDLLVRLDSYNHEPTSAKKGIKTPDFLIVAATPRLHNDEIVLIVEVKSAYADYVGAQGQLFSYLKLAAKKGPQKIHGMLVRNSVCDFYQLTPGNEPIPGVANIGMDSDELDVIIQGIASGQI